MYKIIIPIFAALVAFSSLLADELPPYQRSIESSTVYTRDESSLVQIKLSDGTTWNCQVKLAYESLLVEIEQLLQPGNRVVLSSPEWKFPYVGLCILKDNRVVNKVCVTPTKATKLQLPKLVNITSTLSHPGGWFTHPTYTHIITLSDGAILEYTENLHDSEKLASLWQKGHTILVSSFQGPHGIVFAMINLDRVTEEQKYSCLDSVKSPSFSSLIRLLTPPQPKQNKETN
jgi:hypothetical protein